MDSAIVFDKRAQLEHLQGCEDIFRSLREEHDVHFDEEDSFKKSAREFMDILDIGFPQKSDKIRVAKILQSRPDLKQSFDLKKVEKTLDSSTKHLKNIHHLLSTLKEGHDGLEEKLEHALWLRDWFGLRQQVSNRYDFIEEAIPLFKTGVQELTMISEMIVTIRQITVLVLLELCDASLEDLLKYRIRLIDQKDYMSLVTNLSIVLEEGDPMSDVSLSSAASQSKEKVIADLEQLETSLSNLVRKLFSQWSMVILIKDKNWVGATARVPFLKESDQNIKRYFSEFRQHSQELIRLIQQK